MSLTGRQEVNNVHLFISQEEVFISDIFFNINNMSELNSATQLVQ